MAETRWLNKKVMHRTLFAGTLSLAMVAMGKPAFEPAVSWAQAAATEPQVATGVVFEDRNKNGRRDAQEPAVRHVSVSNGREVVRTDSQGRYRINVTDETIIFVTKPSGYMVPVDDKQLPEFYYIHYPNGSPVETDYPGISPTGPLPESVNFPLYKEKESDTFQALVFADPQTTTLAELDDLRTDVANELTDTDASFGVTAGDVVNDPLDLFGPHNEIIATMGVPWWNLPGNHDINYDVPDDTYSTETYKSVYGPTDYSFDYGQAHFVNMDNIDYLGEGRGYRGYLDERRLEWLANDLAHVSKDKLIVITTHIPLRTEAIGDQAQNTVNLDQIFEVLKDRKHIFSTSGHDTSNSWQTYMEPGEMGPTPPGANPAVWPGKGTFHHQVLAEVRGGGWSTGPTDARGVPAADMADGNPNGYYFLDVEGNDYRMRYKPASLPEDFQMRITFRGGEGNRTLSNGVPVWIPSGPSGSGGISPAPRFAPGDWNDEQVPLVEANVFDGGERHRVEVRFDDGKFSPMDYNPPSFGVTDGDPNGNLDTYIRALRESLEGSERPVNPEPSSHIWTVPVPQELGAGEHTVTIRSIDPYGRTTKTSQRFDVLGS
ncbi:calcineurin-like phosphoesterase C-terminal domain-containing protein [Actinopolymorpha sp. B11F2]|uniref:calcineurin-like phosphoesterase C-terminal domain-containing protein n=1 Tax=Actinopolymorpha sp. B11F2 TaxID=3160862 RepID=UPI0032E42DDD